MNNTQKEEMIQFSITLQFNITWHFDLPYWKLCYSWSKTMLTIKYEGAYTVQFIQKQGWLSWSRNWNNCPAAKTSAKSLRCNLEIFWQTANRCVFKFTSNVCLVTEVKKVQSSTPFFLFVVGMLWFNNKKISILELLDKKWKLTGYSRHHVLLPRAANLFSHSMLQ